jgi:hypothetical protein
MGVWGKKTFYKKFSSPNGNSLLFYGKEGVNEQKHSQIVFLFCDVAVF